MKLKQARVQNYWSIHDTGWFGIEDDKTVIVGPNEAGKTAVLRALQTINMPPGRRVELNPLRDYPRSRYREIDEGEVELGDVVVATAAFVLEDHDRVLLGEYAPHLETATELYLSRYYDGTRKFWFGDLSMWASFGDVEAPLAVLRAELHSEPAADHATLTPVEGAKVAQSGLAEGLGALTADWTPSTTLRDGRGQTLDAWLDDAAVHLDFERAEIHEAFEAVRTAARRDAQVTEAFEVLETHIPFFVYFSQYVKVQPRIHLGRLAAQEAAGDLDEDYDLGNLCLLRYLGLSAIELAELGRGVPDVRSRHGQAVPPSAEEIAAYQARLDRRSYRLNDAALKLTKAINGVWGDDRELDILPDGQYLKVVVRNEDGARVELDQGSEGFRWLVSFHVVFEAQSRSKEANAVLLLDEPGVSLHALKQEKFRDTITKIAARNQTLFTTHSPFMVASDEMRRVRIVEMADRDTGTRVHQDFAVGDPRSLFLLQSHFGYELGQTMFEHQRNVVVEAITDYWYLLALAAAARDAGEPSLDDDVAVIPAGDAGKIAYHASVLHSQQRRVAALFGSDPVGFAAATDEPFVHLMKKQRIHLVGEFYDGEVERPQLEDLLRETLLDVARDELGIDAWSRGFEQPGRPVCDLLGEGVGGSFTRHRLAKGFLRWMGGRGWYDLRERERESVRMLLAAVNETTL